jgi:hypothetical protein
MNLRPSLRGQGSAFGCKSSETVDAYVRIFPAQRDDSSRGGGEFDTSRRVCGPLSGAVPWRRVPDRRQKEAAAWSCVTTSGFSVRDGSSSLQ